jgi:hypothetical protein
MMGGANFGVKIAVTKHCSRRSNLRSSEEGEGVEMLIERIKCRNVVKRQNV